MPAGIYSAVSPLTVQTCVHCTLLRTRRDITLCLHCEVHKSENHQRWFKPTHLPQRKPEPPQCLGKDPQRRWPKETPWWCRSSPGHFCVEAGHPLTHAPRCWTQETTHWSVSNFWLFHPPNLVAIVLKRAIRQTHLAPGQRGAGEVVPQVPWAAISHPSWATLH